MKTYYKLFLVVLNVAFRQFFVITILKIYKVEFNNFLQKVCFPFVIRKTHMLSAHSVKEDNFDL